MARKTNYNFEKRQKEIARLKKREEKIKRKLDEPVSGSLEHEIKNES